MLGAYCSFAVVVSLSAAVVVLPSAGASGSAVSERAMVTMTPPSLVPDTS